jgi:hypothetical protein
MLQRFHRCIREEDGAVLLLWALLLPIVAGCLGLGVDAGSWYLRKRDLQSVADAAAIAGAYEATVESRVATAASEVARNGFGSGSGVSVVANNPPLSGSNMTDASAVEVVLSQPQQLAFSAVFLEESPIVNVRAVALRLPAGYACVLALDTSAQYALEFQGNSTINMEDCIAASNSNANISAIVSGSAVLNAQTLYTVGGYDVRGNAELNTSTTPITGGTALLDPYANLAMPSFSGCDHNNYSTSGNATLNPGVYCNGMGFSSHANVTLNPGVYIVDRGAFDVGSHATVSGTGVTIILTSSTGSSHATAEVNGGATVNIAAPTSGTYQGIAFYQNRNAAAGGVNRFNGGATMNITGALYFPNQTLYFTGGATSGAGSCTQIVARIVEFNGNSGITNNCAGTGLNNISVPGVVRLVE